MAVTPGSFALPLAARFSAALLAVCSAGCPPPGRGAKAEAGYRRAAPVIAALERYHQARGSYPETLAELLPEWLPAPPEALGYTRRGGDYELSFGYTGPGVNQCAYHSATPELRWQCHGYY